MKVEYGSVYISTYIHIKSIHIYTYCTRMGLKSVGNGTLTNYLKLAVLVFL